MVKTQKIAKELKKLGSIANVCQPSKHEWDMENLDFTKEQNSLIKKSNKILLLQSIISNTRYVNRNEVDIIKQIKINLLSVIKICEIAIEHNKNAKNP